MQGRSYDYFSFFLNTPNVTYSAQYHRQRAGLIHVNSLEHITLSFNNASKAFTWVFCSIYSNIHCTTVIGFPYMFLRDKLFMLKFTVLRIVIK